MPTFADRLLKDIKLIPMWSCVCRDKFGCRRVPVDSVSVESDFNIIKNIIRKIPIIKNDENLSIGAITFEKTKYSFTNTCAFDNILQLFIVTYLDKDKVKDLINELNNDITFINNECNNIFF